MELVRGEDSKDGRNQEGKTANMVRNRQQKMKFLFATRKPAVKSVSGSHLWQNSNMH